MDIPRHIAIIMDGNGRWAKKRSLPKNMGHRAGAKSVAAVTEACAKLGINALTLYSFSTENWKRPKKEVDALMRLLKENLKTERARLQKNNIKFNVIGRTQRLSQTLRDEIKKVMELTSNNTGMVLTLAISYGSREEILDAARALCREARNGKMDIDSLTEDDFGRFLYTRDLPEPDLIIRTSGEMRLSNFLLWQAAYAEIYVTDVLWPDFREQDLEKALEEYAGRHRRFGE